MNRPYNFGAGPAMLPTELLEEVQAEWFNWQGLHVSILEAGFRTDAFMHMLSDSTQLLRKLLQVPESHDILFLGGAARLQFGMIPLNFLASKKQKAGYLVTGIWSSLALQEALRIYSDKKAYCIASSLDRSYQSLPLQSEHHFEENTAYYYYTPNETINGVRADFNPPDKSVPLVADMTSCLLTEPLNVSDFGLIFAGAQKNIANAGLTLVIVRKNWLEHIDNPHLSAMLDYRVHAKHQSLYATPPTFNCYVAYKMFQWIEKQGGVSALYDINRIKAQKLYDYIDASNFYKAPVDSNARSMVNICFSTPNQSLDTLFVEKAEACGLLALKGHREAGGLRASLYNSMPIQGVEKLLSFMDDFVKGCRNI